MYTECTGIRLIPNDNSFQGSNKTFAFRLHVHGLSNHISGVRIPSSGSVAYDNVPR